VVAGISRSAFEAAFPLFFSQFDFESDWLSMIKCLQLAGWSWTNHTKNAQFSQHHLLFSRTYALILPICLYLCLIFAILHFGCYLSILFGFFLL
jgi:hypothetical protein